MGTQKRYIYKSRIGNILITSNGNKLEEITFVNDDFDIVNQYDEAIDKTIKWLDLYFSKERSNELPPIEMEGNEFQKKIYKILLEIQYGKTVSYEYVKNRYLDITGRKTMATQAVAHAISKNRIAIIIPCHRVISKNGNIGGYAFGTETKRKLLEIEGVFID